MERDDVGVLPGSRESLQSCYMIQRQLEDRFSSAMCRYSTKSMCYRLRPRPMRDRCKRMSGSDGDTMIVQDRVMSWNVRRVTRSTPEEE